MQVKGKLDPYKILNLPKQFDEKMLKKAYLKAALDIVLIRAVKTHSGKFRLLTQF